MAALTYGVVCRPKAGREVCGDGYLVLDGPRPLVVVADGLGSGPAAGEASQAALRCVAQAPERPLPVLLEACHEALRETRGAAVAVVAIEPGARRLESASVGNVEIRTRRDVGYSPPPVSGIVGANYRPPRPAPFEYPRGEWLVIHTDGLRPGFDLDTELMHPTDSAQAFAEHLAETFGRDDDDLTVLVVELP